MFIYNNNINSYKIAKHTEIGVIKKKRVEATSTRQVKTIKPIRKENAAFLTQLGFKVIKKVK